MQLFHCHQTSIPLSEVQKSTQHRFPRFYQLFNLDLSVAADTSTSRKKAFSIGIDRIGMSHSMEPHSQAADIASLPTPKQGVCANTRYKFAGCGHVCLQRCTIHPVNLETLKNSCPDPRAGFSSVTLQRECPKCTARHNPPADIVKMEKTLSQLTEDKAQNHEKRKGLAGGSLAPQEVERTLQACKAKNDVLIAQIQRTSEALKVAREDYESSVGDFGFEMIGMAFGTNYGDPEDFSWIMWVSCDSPSHVWEWES